MQDKPKIAIVMHGQAGTSNKYGTGTELDVELSYKHFKKHILDKNPNVDVFMHSWSTDRREKLVNLYSPKIDYFEPQITFDFEYTVGDPNGPGGEISKWKDGKFKGLDNLRFHGLFSRWYSAKMANELRLINQCQNNFVYDYVMLTRYDLAYVEDFDFSSFDTGKFYAIPPISHHGIQDLWFIGSDKDMTLLCQMYDWIKKINHFPHKFTHSHWLTLKFINNVGLDEKLDFFGSERPWGQGPVGAKLGPSPLVRDHYNIAEKTPDSAMGEVRNKLRQISERKITW